VLKATPKSILRAHRAMANPQHGGNYAADSRDIGSMTGLMRSTQSPNELDDEDYDEGEDDGGSSSVRPSFGTGGVF
jgi:hypothetical protein